MKDRFSNLPKLEPFSLLDPQTIENMPAIQGLMQIFHKQLPERFGQTRIYISPIIGSQSAMRSDCTTRGCSVRAVIHIRKSSDGWEMVEDQILFDRTSNACGECKILIGKR